MKTIPLSFLSDSVNRSPVAIALGNFDGVHLAHRALLHKAQESPYTPAVFTFDKEVKNYLTTVEERATLLQSFGIELLFLAPFPLVKDLSCREFVLFLKEKLSCHEIICGYNFRFGKGAEGDTEMLKALCDEYAVSLSVLPEQKKDGISISSSAIRALLSEGRPEDAARLLGRPFSLSGMVEKGYSIGKKLKVPTLNLSLAKGAVPLCHGVYITRTTVGGKSYPSITNIGRNPTFDRDKVTCETNLFDVSGNFYGEKVTVNFLTFLRPEKKFPSFEALQEAIQRDIEASRAYHKI